MDDLEKLETTVEGFCRFIEELPKAAMIGQEWVPILATCNRSDERRARNVT
jgi:hypothetical protein